MDKLFRTALADSTLTDSWYPSDFRVSSLPYCPILDLLGWLEQEPRIQEYQSDFYFAIGTAVHNTLQFHLSNSPRGKRAFGNWSCMFCKQTTEKPQFRPSDVPPCHPFSRWIYVEMEFKHKGLSGHLDYLTQDKNGNWVAYEFKTASYFVTRPGAKSKSIPYPKHHVQIESYCVLLWLLFKIRVKYIRIIYVSRENPSLDYTKTFLSKFTKARYRFRLQELTREFQGRKAVLSAIANLGSAWDLKVVQKVIKHRPCFSREDYSERMEKGFFQSACPLLRICAKTKVPKVEEHMRKAWLNADHSLIRKFAKRFVT